MIYIAVLSHDVCPDCPSFLRATAYAIARPSVRPSVTGVNPTKTVDVRIMKFSPYGSPSL